MGGFGRGFVGEEGGFGVGWLFGRSICGSSIGCWFGLRIGWVCIELGFGLVLLVVFSEICCIELVWFRIGGN